MVDCQTCTRVLERAETEIQRFSVKIGVEFRIWEQLQRDSSRKLRKIISRVKVSL